MKVKNIKVCRNCSFPITWTFLFDQYEYYCVNCGGKTGMMGGGENVAITQKLKAEKRISEQVFNAIRKYHMGNGNFYRETCKKCVKDGGCNHLEHANEYEKELNTVADNFLKRLINN